jgi:hypothetical protein
VGLQHLPQPLADESVIIDQYQAFQVEARTAVRLLG